MICRIRSEPAPATIQKRLAVELRRLTQLSDGSGCSELASGAEPEASEQPVPGEAEARPRERPQKRRDSFHSLGSHVSWTALLEYAGDSPEAWRSRKVHRWLGMSEEHACVFLQELVELRDALNSGAQPDTQAGPAAEPLKTPRDIPPNSGFFSLSFWGGARGSTEQPQQQPEQQFGLFSWLFSAGLAKTVPKVPNTVRPMRVRHEETAEYSLQDLDEVGLLGRGAFGSVTLVRCRKTSQLLAMKAVSKGMLVEMQLQHSVSIEKAVMQATCSQYLVKMAATFNRNDRLYFLLEAVMGGDLYTVYRRFDLFGSEAHARFYAACAVRGFEHLHERRILYRDLKMENLVLDLRGYCKLCDFGTSTFDFDEAFTMCGTPEYMSPEVVCGNGHGPAADWWSMGVLVYELVLSVTPFAEDEPLQIFAKAKAGIEKVEGFAERHEPWAELVRGFCRQDPKQRLPMLAGGTDNVRAQEWYRGFDWDALDAGQLQAPHTPPCSGPEDLCNFAGEEQECPLELPYVDQGDGWDASFEDPVGPANVYSPAA